MSLMRTTRLYATEELWSIGQEITRELSRRYGQQLKIVIVENQEKK